MAQAVPLEGVKVTHIGRQYSLHGSRDQQPANPTWTAIWIKLPKQGDVGRV
jgi:hypothetical protein